MYIRQAKQFLRNIDSTFDERKFGFASLVDLLRACQREGLFRIERDRQGVMRVFPGNIMQTATTAALPVGDGGGMDDDNRGNVAEPRVVDDPEDEADEAVGTAWAATPAAPDSDIVEGGVVQAVNVPLPLLDAEDADAGASGTPEPTVAAKGRSRGGRGRTKTASAAKGGESRSNRKTSDTGAPRTRKTPATPARPRAPRTRARKDTPPA